MRMSTFCMLLASALLLAGALIGSLMKTSQNETEEKAHLASGQEVAETAIITVGGRIERYYGAEYSQELNQWTKNLGSVIETEEGEEIRAMTDCTVVSAEPTEGGSRIELTDGETTVVLQPVRRLGVFEGSRLNQGDVLGEAAGKLEISAKRGGEAVDPLVWAVITQ